MSKTTSVIYSAMAILLTSSIYPKGAYPRQNASPFVFLGYLADQGEADWKVLTISQADSNADRIRDPDGIEQIMPGKLGELMKWFEEYDHTGVSKKRILRENRWP